MADGDDIQVPPLPGTRVMPLSGLGTVQAISRPPSYIDITTIIHPQIHYISTPSSARDALSTALQPCLRQPADNSEIQSSDGLMQVSEVLYPMKYDPPTHNAAV